MIRKLFGRENMGNRQPVIWLRLLGIFCITVVVFVALLTLVMLIPNAAISENYERSMEVFKEEGDGWNRVYTYASGSMTDNLTDSIIIGETMVNENCSAISNALSGNGYSRYWHGYLVWVRPVLLVFSYLDIRYILMFVFMFLLAACIINLNRRLGKASAYIFTLCMGLAYFIIIPWSLQFCEVFLITMTAVLYILKHYNADWKVYKVGELFLLLGMITQYLDFLTSPLLTLGLPLCIILIINIRETAASDIRNWASLIHSCITWAIGWAAGWIAKWVVGTIVLQRNIIEDALNQASFRVNGNESSQVNRIAAVAKNVYSMLPFSNVIGKGEKTAMIIVAALYIIVLAVCLYLWIRYRRKGMWIAYLPVLVIALLPVAWYIVMAQHSQVHTFFTYRTQVMSYFALPMAYVGCIDWKKLALSAAGARSREGGSDV